MRVLVIGASDTLGTYLPDPAEGTFGILARELSGVLGAPAEVSHMRFYSHFKNAPQHAAASVATRAPDIAIVAAHSMAFATPSIGARLVHLFGWKVGRWLERRIWRADASARRHRVVAGVRKPARAVVHRLVGPVPYATVEATIRHYAETISLLSRVEDMELVVLGTFQHRRGGDIAPHAKLNEGLAAIAAAHRVPWIDRQAIVTALGDQAFQPNGEYSSPLTHRKVADAVLAALKR